MTTLAFGGRARNGGRTDGVGTAALLNVPIAVVQVPGASTSSDPLFLLDSAWGLLRAATPANGSVAPTLSTLAGGGAGGTTRGCAGGFGSNALFSFTNVGGGALAASGGAGAPPQSLPLLYAADAGCHNVRLVVLTSGSAYVVTLAGSASAALAGAGDGAGTRCSRRAPARRMR